MKNRVFDLKFLWVLALSIFAFAACDNDDDTDPPMDQDIVEYLQADENYSLLVDAVIKADLVTTLQSAGPFTVFAPNNTSFQAFLDAAGTGSIEATPADVLKSVLLNHVLGGKFLSTDLSTGYATTAAPTAFDANTNLSLFIEVASGQVTLNGESTVTEADLETTNGVIHKVSAVIGLPTVVTFALSNPDLSSLVAALTRADLTTDFVGVLSGEGPFTVFAPTNAAFAALLTDTGYASRDEVPVDLLESILKSHVTTAGNVRSTDLSDGQEVPMLEEGVTLTVGLGDSDPTLTSASNTVNIVFTDVQANNGVVHVIDAVILP